MIINGFGGRGAGTLSNSNDWITLFSHSHTWSGALTTSYSDQYAWVYPSGPSFVWPDLTPYSYVRVTTSALSISLNTAKTYQTSSSYAPSIRWQFCFYTSPISSLGRISTSVQGKFREVTFTMAKSKTITPTVNQDIITNPPENLTVSGNKGTVLPIGYNFVQPELTYTTGSSYVMENPGLLYKTGWFYAAQNSGVSSELIGGATVYYTLVAYSATSSGGSTWWEGSNFTINGTFNFQVLPR